MRYGLSGSVKFTSGHTIAEPGARAYILASIEARIGETSKLSAV